MLVDERRSGRGQGAREAERAARVGQAGEGDEAGPGASAAQIVDQRAVALEEPGLDGVAGRVEAARERGDELPFPLYPYGRSLR